jgi:hypothetical protein
MGEFEQLFGPAGPPPQPQQVTIDVTGHDAAALDGLCRCLALVASGSGPVSSEGLSAGLLAVQSVVWQIQSGFGLAASGMGWIAGFTDLHEVGQKLLTLTGGGQELHLQMDAAGRFFAGTWQNPAAPGAAALTFAVNTAAGASEFRAYWPVEVAIPLAAPVPGWTDSAPAVSARAGRPAPAAMPAPAAAPAAPAPAAVPAAPVPAAAPAPATAPAAPPGWSLTIRSGASAGQKVPLSGTLRIGRGLQNDLVLPDDAASRNHAMIEASESACTVADLGSTNGTFVNGVRVEQATALKDGDVVVCGQTEMVVTGPPPAFEAQKTVMLKVPVFQPAPPAAPPQAAPPAWPSPQPTPYPAAAPEPAAAACPHCGKPLVGSPKFCAYCGRQLR